MIKAINKSPIKATVKEVKTEKKISEMDALVIPGGESTTIGKLLRMYKIDKQIIRFAKEGKPIMGTCAGTVLLASKVEDNEYNLKLMDMQVERNAFGRQRESFESDISVESFNKNYHAIFIRAPAIKKVWGKCKIMSKYNGYGVMAKQENILSMSFHPELTDDTRVHEYFLKLI